ncbi:glycosyltransferase [Tamlana sp. 2201CG12-4]|uniref:glycosyltransferase family 2 protein n=1 Tax=Tamlana sp. 2201CG12-4 TaxID=3112582 RepID=UPI002DB61B42|nr:glycosyltransferase [Tamlana sp. 2201CG12-4]MEC3907355.1 glycosyltransferase [Tamlana sp. 2201CG12-4]
MKFSLIICTYMRPKPLQKLLQSVKEQTLYPNEILIIDGSSNEQTEEILNQNQFKNLKYFKAKEEHRGLTKQRNYGVQRVEKESEIICFLDDDTELFLGYFEAIINTFKKDETVIGVGGVAVNESRWLKKDIAKVYPKHEYYEFDGYIIKESSRNVVRNKFGLQSPLPPGHMPDFSNGRTYSYPLNNKTYQVDLLIGMSFSFRKELFENINFSTYFEGYGLYEDADFSIRALEHGKNVICTQAKLNHYHDQSGRPNKYKYGKMVVRNGWYVWRLKYPKPNLKARLKWNLTLFLLTIIRGTNILTTNHRKEAFTETLGRVVGWFSLFFYKPGIKR